MKTNVEKMFEMYQEICEVAGMEWTLEGWNFFDKVMWVDYQRHCKSTGTVPNMKAFKRNCILIAMDMVDQAK